MPFGKSKPAYYWESSIFITWFLGGTQHPDVFDALGEIVKSVNRNQVQIVTSVLTRAELLESNLPSGAIRTYDALFQRRSGNMIEQPIVKSVAELASSLRAHFPALKKAKRMQDALHLATAVAYSVDEMHTTDDALLACDGDPLLRGVRVLKPSTPQAGLLKGVPPIVTP